MPQGYWDNSSFWQRVRRVYRRGGFFFLIISMIRAFFRPIRVQLLDWYYRIFPLGTFSFRGQRYAYLAHKYNTTWQNERAVEIPIAHAIIKRYAGKRILEVGHVLGHYLSIRHDVLDKYELNPAVMNEDITTFKPGEKYDLIVSISTLEHVGWDEDKREPDKVLEAFRNLQDNCLAPGGTLFVTLPVGWNPVLDQFIKEGAITFQERFYLKKTHNEWREVLPQEGVNSAYNRSVPSATAILIGVIRQKGASLFP